MHIYHILSLFLSALSNVLCESFISESKPLCDSHLCFHCLNSVLECFGGVGAAWFGKSYGIAAPAKKAQLWGGVKSSMSIMID